MLTDFLEIIIAWWRCRSPTVIDGQGRRPDGKRPSPEELALTRKVSIVKISLEDAKQMFLGRKELFDMKSDNFYPLSNAESGDYIETKGGSMWEICAIGVLPATTVPGNLKNNIVTLLLKNVSAPTETITAKFFDTGCSVLYGWDYGDIIRLISKKDKVIASKIFLKSQLDNASGGYLKRGEAKRNEKAIYCSWCRMDAR